MTSVAAPPSASWKSAAATRGAPSSGSSTMYLSTSALVRRSATYSSSQGVMAVGRRQGAQGPGVGCVGERG